MQEEYESIMRNGTWELEFLKGRDLTECKCVYKTKLNGEDDVGDVAKDYA